MTKQTLLALLLLFSLLSTGLAQTPQAAAKITPSNQTTDEKDDVVRITTNLVQVDAVVTKDGKPVKDLKAEDFEIFEDGRKQTITSFAYISNVQPARSAPQVAESSRSNGVPPLPPAPLRPHDTRRTMALVVDDLGLSAESMNAVRKQLRKFVSEQLQPNDMIAIIRTGGEMGALQQFTNDRRVLEKALSQVKWNICSRVGVHVLPPQLGGALASSPFASNDDSPCAMYSFYNTMKSLRFIVEAMSELPGRKSMVVFSDSMPREDQEVQFGDRDGDLENRFPGTRNYSFLLKRIAEMAIRSSTVIYAVDTQGLQVTGLTAADNIQASSPGRINEQINNLMRSRSNLILQRREGADLIARQTGGFLVRNSNDFQLDRILEDQSGYYLLGYRPADETFNKTFHKIKARVKRSGMSLRTRYGFYGVSEEEAANVSKRTPVDQTNIALMSPFGARDIHLELATLFGNDKTFGSILRSFLYLDPHDLTFKDDAEGAHVATLEINGILFGNNGAVTDRQSQTVQLRLKGQPYEDAMREGFVLRFDMPIKRPGSYQFRVAIRDTASAKLGATGMYVSVPNLSNRRLALSGIVLRKSAGPTTQTATTPQQESVNSLAVRRYAPLSELHFACAIYNAQIDPATNQPKLELQARLFRDDKIVYTGQPIPVDVSKQADLARILGVGEIRLEPKLEPGAYYLQLIVTDALTKEKQQQAIQWIDFDIVKP
jgi:VWFA-related protein